MGGLKRVIVTGGTGGLGSAVCAKFRKEKWGVEGLGSADLDLTDGDAVRGFFANRRCDLLVCAAGIIRDKPIARMGEGEWDDVFGVNFTAAKRCADAAIHGMAGNGGGHVVFICSYAAVKPAIGQAAYATAKAALLGLTKWLALEHGRENVRVNAVLPGFLETPMTAAVTGKRTEAVRDSHFLGEFNTRQVAADFIWFLQERMPFTSGQTFNLDSRP